MLGIINILLNQITQQVMCKHTMYWSSICAHQGWFASPGSNLTHEISCSLQDFQATEYQILRHLFQSQASVLDGSTPESCCCSAAAAADPQQPQPSETVPSEEPPAQLLSPGPGTRLG